MQGHEILPKAHILSRVDLEVVTFLKRIPQLPGAYFRALTKISIPQKLSSHMI